MTVIVSSPNTATQNGAVKVPTVNAFDADLPAEPAVEFIKPISSASYTATHPEQFEVVFSESAEPGVEAFSSKLVAKHDYAPGELLATLSNASQAPVKAYSSVQYGPGPDHHLELNSDLLFMNHSCAPTAQLQLPAGTPARWEVHVGPAGLAKGEDITFFYPSTEWDMAQGFDCNCGAKTCLGNVQGAKYLTLEQLEARGVVNDHIRALKAQQ
ncbi:uncharacterized protein EHS24_008601 [Apiotrichum porosum]|uniref:Post-SET domain-containing protein n=1 Tax=Apiotrichum porosum TaxID=105984 RepID=A0A427XQM7_9TREE|nr:uncharacterized protein EHS24_008601 [Apiotrichum porosum]RSH81164.1 hypothetical protein EHS24_008601 [Apiotrichum porosum]